MLGLNPLLTELSRAPIAQGTADEEPIIVFADPGADCRSRIFKGGKIIQPRHLFLGRPDHPFGLCVALGIIVRTENLVDAQPGRVLHEGHRGRLRSAVGKKVQPLVPHSPRKLLTERPVQSLFLIRTLAPERQIPAHDLFGVPVQNDN